METILIVEDDPAILLGLSKNLAYEGFRILSETNGERGLARAIDEKIDLILLDIMLPGIDGFEILRTLRSHDVGVPVIALTARDRESDKIAGLGLGADDYLTKPFSVRELLARIQAVLRRSKRVNRPSSVIRFGDIEVDFDAHCVRRKGRETPLTTRELRLLEFLIDNAGRALSRKDILDRVWGYDYYGTSRTIDNFINRLRAKLESDPDLPRTIVTVRGIGYKFVGEIRE